MSTYAGYMYKVVLKTLSCRSRAGKHHRLASLYNLAYKVNTIRIRRAFGERMNPQQRLSCSRDPQV